MRDMPALVLARALRIERRARGIKQCELAGKIGVRPWTLSAWEREYSHPTITSLERWAEALGFQVALKPVWVELRSYEG